MCFVWLSVQTVAFALCVINRLVSITEVESVYCAVRTGSLYVYNTDTFRPSRVNSKLRKVWLSTSIRKDTKIKILNACVKSVLCMDAKPGLSQVKFDVRYKSLLTDA